MICLYCDKFFECNERRERKKKCGRFAISLSSIISYLKYNGPVFIRSNI